MNYNVFDPFLNMDTWHTSHPLDDRRFFVCLSKVVREPDFSAETLGEYIRKAKGIDNSEHHFAPRVRDLVGKAWAVREYLEATGGL
jgi:hypothetical protein